MPFRDLSEIQRRYIRTITTASLGALVGGIVLLVGDLEYKWLIYITGGLVLATMALMIRNQEPFIWGLLVLALQFDVTFRVLHGYAGTSGLAFPLPVVIGLCLVGWYLLSGNIRLHRIRWAGQLGFPIAAMFGTSLVSLLTTSEQFIVVSALVTQCELYLLYLLAFNCIRCEQQFDRVLKLLFAVLAIQSIIYFIQSSLGVTFTLTGEIIAESSLPRPGGTASTNPLGFAQFILPILLIAIAHFIGVRPKIRSRFYTGFVAILGLGALVLTLTRSAWGAFVIGIAWVVVFSYRRALLSIPKLLLIGGVSVAVSAAAIPMITERLEREPLAESYDERKALMEMAILVIAANPLSGVGANAYDLAYKQYLTSELAERWQYKVHNHYLLRTAETGIPGGIAFILLLVGGLRQAMRVTHSSQFAVSATAIGWGAGIIAECFAMFWDIWTAFPVHSLFWFLLGLMEAAEAIEKHEREASKSKVAQRL